MKAEKKSVSSETLNLVTRNLPSVEFIYAPKICLPKFFW